jgi:hypothetical protein
MADFRRLWRANLGHEPQDYPFYHFDPRIAGTPGDVYWSLKLRQPIARFGKKRVAETFFAVEFFPYMTSSGIGQPAVPSQEYTFSLVRDAMAGGAIIIRMRYPWWLRVIPGLIVYTHYYELNNPRNVAITKKNCPQGYAKIRQVLGGLREGASNHE